MRTYQIMEGSPGLALSDVGHVFSPGRGRDESGHGLSIRTRERAIYAGYVFIDHELEAANGVLVASGYKTPADKAGDPWSVENGFSPSDDDVKFQGKPEADSTGEIWLEMSISEESIRRERRSIDTVTNFARTEAENYFPDGRPVAIVAQEKHLERMIDHIAPKTLRRDYIGVVVPEGDNPDQDTFFARLESQAVLLGIRPNSHYIVQRTEFSARAIWGGVNLVRRVIGTPVNEPTTNKAAN